VTKEFVDVVVRIVSILAMQLVLEKFKENRRSSGVETEAYDVYLVGW